MNPAVTQAFVLGAGLGTRLHPLTEEMPKPLIPIFHKPLITFAIDHLRSVGVESFVINTHRLAEKFEEFFGHEKYAGSAVQLAHEPILLGTGGGIKNAERFLSRAPFFVYSGDILTDIDLTLLRDEHFRAGNDVTLALRETGLAHGVAFRDGRVLDIGERLGHAGQYDFANVSLWNPEIFGRIPPNEALSFVPVLTDWMRAGGRVGGVIVNEKNWFNIGSRTEYLNAHRTIIAQNWKPDYVSESAWPQCVDPTATIAPSAQLRGVCSIGAHCRIEADVVLEDTIAWPGAQIASRSDLRNCIVRSRQKVAGHFIDVDI